MPISPPRLWDYASALYAQDDIAARCLSLQDEYDFDVNLLLFCCWYGEHLGEIPVPLMQSLFEYSLVWQDKVVRPTRSTRRWLKTQMEDSPGEQNELNALREKVKELELHCERQQLQMLESMAAAIELEHPAASARIAIRRNFMVLRNQMGNEDIIAIDQLLEGLLDGLPDLSS